jgi:uncharacterized protein YecT (DUF1311 family)
MPHDDSYPDLTKLDGDYQILTELHGEGDSRTYLARHLQLNRDVTISIFSVLDEDHAKALAQFASDVQRLTEARFQHVVPIIEGLWLDDRTFATVRARVRGATLDQTLSASGPMPMARVATTVREIAEAVTWSREIGIAQREVAPWDIVFQQGSGRVLLSFEPGRTALATLRTECDDVRTIRRLAVEMLAGEISRDSKDGVAVPRNIPTDVADALAAMRHCTVRNAGSAVSALLKALDAAARKTADEKTQIAAPAISPVADAVVVEPEPSPPPVERVIPTDVQQSVDVSEEPIPVITGLPSHRTVLPNEGDEAVVVVKPSFGFNARFGTAIVAVAVVGALGIWLLNRDGSPPPATTAAVATPDTGSSAAGEVALHRTPAPAPVPSVARDSNPSAPKRPARDDSSKPRKKAVVVDSAAEAERVFQRDSAADVADPCFSPDVANQQRCLMAAIDRNDRDLNAVYARLIAALRRQSGVASGDPDPDSVDDLRASQRKWVDARDVACRRVGDGPLYAKSRSACFAQQSADRTRELKRRLDAMSPN